MLCSTDAIVGGHGDANNFAPGIAEPEELEARHHPGPQDRRAAIRYAVKHGADVIKIMSSGGAWPAASTRQFSDEELHLLVEEASSWAAGEVTHMELTVSAPRSRPRASIERHLRR
jgi:hypothetical protein